MASHTKPTQVCYLRKDKAVGAHDGFAATFNWIVDWVWNFRVGDGLKFEQTPDSAHPKVSLDDENGGGSGGGIEFASESDSNVTFRTGDDGKVYVGVYWV